MPTGNTAAPHQAAPSVMLSILGAGFGRTGTLSLKRALEIVGCGPCYHMATVVQNPDHAGVWVSAARGERADWRSLLDGYAAAVDWPVTMFWRDILIASPNIRVILTVRDAAAWYASFLETIVGHTEGLAPPPGSHLRALYDLTRELILEGVFGGRANDERHARALYEQHNRGVCDTVPPPQLLVYDVTAGWEPLCSFLARPVPNETFPHVNTRAGFLGEDFGTKRRRSATLSSQ
jgi:hypothetical protein